jgi:hypothetical protein
MTEIIRLSLSRLSVNEFLMAESSNHSSDEEIGSVDRFSPYSGDSLPRRLFARCRGKVSAVQLVPVLGCVVAVAMSILSAPCSLADDAVTPASATATSSDYATSSASPTPKATEGISTPSASTSSAAPTASPRARIADASSTYTFADNSLCNTEGAVNINNGALAIDFSSTDLDGFGTVIISELAAASCRDSISSLNITNRGSDPVTSLTIEPNAFVQSAANTSRMQSVSFPTGLTSLTIGDQAFLQSFDASATSGLASVTFPNGLVTLDIGSSAFSQQAEDSDTSLTSISFPTSLRTLTVGTAGFLQTAWTGSTSLTSVTFPDGLQTLSIASDAFRQEATGGSVTLALVSFPGSLNSLSLGSMSFYQLADDTPGGPALAMIVFRAAGIMGDGTGEVYIDSEFESAAEWVWFGDDATDFSAAWNVTSYNVHNSPVLVGNRSITFDTGQTATTSTDYVYRGSKAYTTPTVFDPTTLGSGWTITLPTASKQYYTLIGWCETAGCDNPLASGATYVLSSLHQTLYAAWSLNPPTITTDPQLPQATVGAPYEQTIETVGGGTITCAVTAGTLPPGMTLTGCELSGTPTTAGDYTFTVTASNEGGSTSRTFHLPVVAASTLATTGSSNAVELGILAVALLSLGVGATVIGRKLT